MNPQPVPLVKNKLFIGAFAVGIVAVLINAIVTIVMLTD